MSLDGGGEDMVEKREVGISPVSRGAENEGMNAEKRRETAMKEEESECLVLYTPCKECLVTVIMNACYDFFSFLLHGNEGKIKKFLWDFCLLSFEIIIENAI